MIWVVSVVVLMLEGTWRSLLSVIESLGCYVEYTCIFLCRYILCLSTNHPAIPRYQYPFPYRRCWTCDLSQWPMLVAMLM
jgi:hypothetical protein